MTKLAFEFGNNVLRTLAVLHLPRGPEMSREAVLVCLPIEPMELVQLQEVKDTERGSWLQRAESARLWMAAPVCRMGRVSVASAHGSLYSFLSYFALGDMPDNGSSLHVLSTTLISSFFL